MKVSLAWIYDHIDGDWSKVNVAQLADLFNKMTAEMTDVKKFSLDLHPFTLARVTCIEKTGISAFSPELQKDCRLQLRSDCIENSFYLIICDGDTYRWATVADIGGDKDGLLPAFYCDELLASGAWKKEIETEDYILEVDNKSITNRPDMWCHRGTAREVAALLKQTLKPLEKFITHKVVKEYEGSTAPSSSENPYSITVENYDVCKRYVGLYIDFIEPRPSMLNMAFRLARIGSRPLSAIVDGTNYVMFDIGQPLHAFDTDKIATRSIVTRFARAKEQLSLLDKQTVLLTDQDYLITDGQHPIALAGIMGGSQTAVDQKTQSIFLESACFDAGVIRKTAANYHVRTESSVRYEKSLDPNLTILGLLRLLRVWSDAGINMRANDTIVTLGHHKVQPEIIVPHECIEKRIGVSLTEEFVINILTQLEFQVTKDPYAAQTTYIVKVPTFRATKDITIKEDVIEEIARFFGYGSIPVCLPSRSMGPFSLHDIHRVRTIKDCMANSISMREVCNYAMFDESFVNQLGWQPERALVIKNPVSENWCHMVTTLIPGLLKNVITNKPDAESLRFFEWGRTWQSDNKPIEQKVLAGIFFDQKKQIDFYESKTLLMRLFKRLDIDVTWQKIDKPDYPWLAPYQSAYIMHKGTKVGYAGKGNCALLGKLFEGDTWIFELNGDFLQSYKAPHVSFVPMPKYPGVERDVSAIVPSTLTVDHLTSLIKDIDPIIISVSLVDFFTKEDWFDKRSLTFRCLLQDPNKTLTTQEVDIIWSQVLATLQQLGAQIR
jgi:phenylalanyl-tRNA synthetase beta chain